MEDGGRGIGPVAKFRHLLARLHERAQAGDIDFGGGPVGVQDAKPSFFFQRLDDQKRVIFVGKLLDLVAQGVVADVLDVIAFLGGVVALLGALFERPGKAGGEAGGADQARGVLEERVILEDADKLSSRSATPLKGSCSRPFEPSFSESAMALMVKSRRRRSSVIVAGVITGGLPVLRCCSLRDMLISARTFPGRFR